MSTPERQDDPGEYGYGSAKQEPDAERADEAGAPTGDEEPSAPDDEPEPAA